MPRSDAQIAVVGAGLIGRKHIALVAEHATLDAVVDPAPAAREIAAAHGARWEGDLDTYLASTAPDGVIVASPNQLHLAHGRACLAAGVPALIEKPLADTSQAAQALVSMVEETGVPVLVGHHRRHSGVIAEARALIDSGKLGRLVAVNAFFWLNKPDDYFDVDWRRAPGGGPTYINLIHDIDLLQYLCGPIAEVQAQESNAVRGFDVEDTSAAILRFASGVLGTVTISDTVSAPWSWELTSGENPVYPRTDQSCYMVAGTKGAVSLPDLRFWTHTGTQSWWSHMETARIGHESPDPVAMQFLHFLDVIDGKAAPRVTAADGARNIDVLDAIKAAARSGGVVPVGEA